MIRFEPYNIYGITKYRTHDSKFSLLESDNKYYLTMSKRVGDHVTQVQPLWTNVFGSVRQAAKFLDRYELDESTEDKLCPKELTEAYEFIKVFYAFTEVDEDVLEKQINSTSIVLEFTPDEVVITCGDDEPQAFYNAEDLIKYLDELLESFQFEVLSSTDINNATSGKATILAGISSRDISKNMVRVKSSNVWSYCIYIKDRRDKTGDVFVQFKGPKGGPGDVYRYYDVPISIWHKVLSSPSKGHAVWQYLRGKYIYAKLTGDKKTKMRGGI